MKALRNFAVAFVFSLLVVSIAAVFIVNAVEGMFQSVYDKRGDDLANILASSGSDPGKDNNSEGGDASENKLENIEGESFSMLLVCTDYRPGVYDNYITDTDSDKDGNNKDKDKGEDGDVGFFENGLRRIGVTNICLVQCSKEYGEFVFTPIAPNTNVYTPSGYDTLYNIYGIYGFDYFRQKIESITGVGIDYYAVVNCTDIGSIVDILGAVYCTVPAEIFTDGINYVGTSQVSKEASKDDGIDYKSFLDAGSYNVGPSSMGLLLYKDLTNGVGDELVITDSYAKGVFANFAKLSQNGLVSMWSRLETYMTYTNITQSFFETNGQLVTAYDSEIAITLTYPGSFKPSSEVDKSTFEPDITKAVSALSKYR